MRFVLCAAIASAPAVASGDGAGGATPSTHTAHVRIQGTTRIDGHLARLGGRLVVTGTVTDDAARPVSSGRVTLGLTRGPEGGAGAGEPVPVSGAEPQACEGPPVAGASGAPLPAPSLTGPDRLGVALDPQGRFCARLRLAPDRYVVHLLADGSQHLDGATADWPVDLRDPVVAIVSLAFDPPRRVLSLGEPTSDVEVVASIEDEGVTRGAPGLRITLSDEAGRALGEADTLPSGHALVRVESARLGPLGPGELRATFAGSATASPTSRSIEIQRRARVDLEADDAAPGGTSRRLPPGNPEDGVAVRVTASARCAPAGCSGVPTGAVEARFDDVVVGAAPLDRGRAELVVTFAPPAAGDATLRLRYLPDAPWLAAGDDLTATLPLSAPSPWPRALLAVAGLATVLWLALGRLSLRRLERDRPAGASKPGSRSVVARVEVLSSLPDGRGWTGLVADAHDGTPLADARVALERRGFERVEVLVETRTSEDGRFTLPRTDVLPGDELVAEGPLHAALRDGVPGSGDLRVALVLRRRAVLDRLVGWARRKGKPFDVRPEPTPGHVRRAAGADSNVGRWADAVERAAFGGESLDSRAHAELEKLAPSAGEAGEAGEPPDGPNRAHGGPFPRAR